MKHTKISMRPLIASASLFLLAAAGCSKEAVQQPTSATTITTEKAAIASVASLSPDAGIAGLALNPKSLLGDYTSHCEKTIFMGQANSSGSNVLIHLTYLNQPKTMVASPDKKHILASFGLDDKYKTWQYVIGYDRATKQIVVEPNEAMAAAIVPGSFKSLLAAYDAKTQSWSFATRFTSLTDNGNETELDETFWK